MATKKIKQRVFNADTQTWDTVHPETEYGQLTGTVPTWNQNTTGTAANATDSSKLNGYTSTDAGTVSTVVRRDSSGDINTRLVRSTYPNETSMSGGLVFRKNSSSDNYNRVCSSTSAIKTWLSAANASHEHTIENVTSLKATLNGKASLTGSNTFTGINSFTDVIIGKNVYFDEISATGNQADANATLKYNAIEITDWNPTTFTLNIPYKNGTLATTSDVSAILSNANTFSGVNTFSQQAIFTRGIKAKDAVVYAGKLSVTDTKGTTEIGGNVIVNKAHIFYFPSTNGTLALTSQIRSDSEINALALAQTQPFYRYTGNIQAGNAVSIANIANASYADITVKFSTRQRATSRIYLTDSDDSFYDNYYGGITVAATDDRSNYFYSVFYIDKSARTFCHEYVGYKDGVSASCVEKPNNSAYAVTTIRFYK